MRARFKEVQALLRRLHKGTWAHVVALELVSK